MSVARVFRKLLGFLPITGQLERVERRGEGEGRGDRGAHRCKLRCNRSRHCYARPVEQCCGGTVGRRSVIVGFH